MNTLLLIVSAIAGFASAIGHSYLSERYILRPLLERGGGGRVLEIATNRRLMRALWHLPSIVWAQIALATMWLLLSPDSFDVNGKAVLAYFGVVIYALSAAINLACIQRPHVGNILLGIAALTLWFGLYG